MNRCPDCKGTGRVYCTSGPNGPDWADCNLCGGSGGGRLPCGHEWRQWRDGRCRACSPGLGLAGPTPSTSAADGPKEPPDAPAALRSSCAASGGPVGLVARGLRPPRGGVRFSSTGPAGAYAKLCRDFCARTVARRSPPHSMRA